MRIPSSLHSTDARSNPDIASSTVAPVEASIGRIGRKISKPTSRRPASPSVIASSAIRGRSPDSISARRAIAPGHSGRLGDRVRHQPGERALAQLPGEQPSQEARPPARSRARAAPTAAACAPPPNRSRSPPAPRRSCGRRRQRSASAPPPARARCRTRSRSRSRRGPGAGRPTGTPRRSPTSSASSRPSSSARIAILRERELVTATSEEAATTSANRVMSSGEVSFQLVGVDRPEQLAAGRASR